MMQSYLLVFLEGELHLYTLSRYDVYFVYIFANIRHTEEVGRRLSLAIATYGNLHGQLQPAKPACIQLAR
jgi:hypothetical protein